MNDSDDFSEDLFREVELEEQLMKEKKKRDSIAQDRSFQFSSHQSNSFISNSTIRQTSNKSPPSTWICSNCSYVNSKDATSCITCSHPRIQSVQNSMPRLSIQSSSSSSFSKEPNWKESLQKSVGYQMHGQEPISTTPTTPHKQTNITDPIISSSLSLSSRPFSSQHSFLPSSSEAILASGFPALDPLAAQTWIYPTNYPVREYQLDIVSKALFQNTLVSLPTGLGKTFIAAVIMFNFYRWFPAGKVIFMAPTRPLVTQQIGACNDIVGIPQNEVAELLGTKSVTERKRLWSTKRVFYCTPQVLKNDLKNEVVNAKLITCLVVDECHRAQGDYAYTTVMKQLLGIHHHFRVLGLSATPGTDIDRVQKVIQNLDINTICIRSRDDPDVKKYLKEVLEEEIVVKLNAKYQRVIEEWLSFVSAPVNRLCNLGVITERNPKKVNKMILLDAQTRLMERRISGVSGQRWSEVMNDISLLMSLTQATQILTQYGVGAFIETLASMRQEITTEKPNPAKVQFITSPTFITYYNKVFQGVRHHEYIHPKLEKLKQFLVDHLMRNKAIGRETRVIVFAQFRSSVQEILNYLRGTDCIRATAFVGQQKKNNDIGILTDDGEVAPTAEKLYDLQPPTNPQRSISSYFSNQSSHTETSAVTSHIMNEIANSAATTGQTQKQQQQVLQDFKAGKYNVLVATCIAEEGLDIGEVDLLICYEGVSSPTRLLQRKGRTGRKRAGRVVILLTEGTEYLKHKRSIQKYNQVTNLLKTRSSSLQMCPHADTLFSSSFHPQLVQEHVNIQEYHYSQIGGHTPKKRTRNGGKVYEHNEEQKKKERMFFESIKGEHLLELIEHQEEMVLSLPDSIDVQQDNDSTYHMAHSDKSLLVSSLNQFVTEEKWTWKYPNSETTKWITEYCTNPPQFKSTRSMFTLQGGFSDSTDSSDNSDSSNSDLLATHPIQFGMDVFKAVENQLQQHNQHNQQHDSVVVVSSDASQDSTISSSSQPIMPLPIKENLPAVSQGLSDSEDISLYELITGSKKVSKETVQPPSVSTERNNKELSLQPSESDSDDDKPLGYLLEQSKNEEMKKTMNNDDSDDDKPILQEQGKKKKNGMTVEVGETDNEPILLGDSDTEDDDDSSDAMLIELDDSDDDKPILANTVITTNKSIDEKTVESDDSDEDEPILSNLISTTNKPVSDKPVESDDDKPILANPVITTNKSIPIKPIESDDDKPILANPISTINQPVFISSIESDDDSDEDKPILSNPISTNNKPVPDKPIESDSDEDKPILANLKIHHSSQSTSPSSPDTVESEEEPILPTTHSVKPTTTKPLTEQKVLSSTSLPSNQSQPQPLQEHKEEPSLLPNQPQPSSTSISVPESQHNSSKSFFDKSSSSSHDMPSKITATCSTLEELSKESSSSSSLIIALLNKQASPSHISYQSTTLQATTPPPITHEIIDSLFPRKRDHPQSVPPPPPSKKVQVIICPLCLTECSSPESLRDHLNCNCKILPPTEIPKEEMELLSSLLDEDNETPSTIQNERTTLQQSDVPIEVVKSLPVNQNPVKPTVPVMDHHPSIQSPVKQSQPIQPLPQTPTNQQPPIQQPIQSPVKQQQPIQPLPQTPTKQQPVSYSIQQPIQPLPQTPTNQPPIQSPLQQQSTQQPSLMDSSFGMNSEEIDRLLEVEISIPSTTSLTCAICHDTSSSSPTRQCSHCKTTVHCSCYGITDDRPINGPWLCDSCKAGVYPVTCALCGKQGGGMKLSVDGLWVHVVCVTWNPSLFFIDNNSLKPDRIRPLLNMSPKHLCCLCNSSVGATVKCYYPSCNCYFHVSCAQDHGYDLDAVNEQDGVTFVIQCKYHPSISSSNNTNPISDTDLFDLADLMEEKGELF